MNISLMFTSMFHILLSITSNTKADLVQYVFTCYILDSFENDFLISASGGADNLLSSLGHWQI